MNRGYNSDFNEPNRGYRGGHEPGNETWGRDSEWSGGGGQNLDRFRDQGRGGPSRGTPDYYRREQDYDTGNNFRDRYRGENNNAGGNYTDDRNYRRSAEYGTPSGYGMEGWGQQAYRGSDFDSGDYRRMSGGQNWRSDEMRGQGYPATDYSGAGRGTGYEQARGGFGGRGSGNASYGQDESEMRRAISAGYPGIIAPSQNQFGPHSGKGPRGYQRADDRIREDVSECLTHHGGIDASEIEIEVRNGEVTLKGTVDDRRQKRMAEEVVENLSGVKDVHNQLRVSQSTQSSAGNQPDTGSQRTDTAISAGAAATTRNNETAGTRGR